MEALLVISVLLGLVGVVLGVWLFAALLRYLHAGTAYYRSNTAPRLRHVPTQDGR